jgi:hypothetical protein
MVSIIVGSSCRVRESEEDALIVQFKPDADVLSDID